MLLGKKKKEPSKLELYLGEIKESMDDMPSEAAIGAMFDRQHDDMVNLTKGVIELAAVIAKFLDLEKQYQELEKQSAKRDEETEADRLF